MYTERDRSGKETVFAGRRDWLDAMFMTKIFDWIMGIEVIDKDY
jgi:hypothetical protein